MEWINEVDENIEPDSTCFFHTCWDRKDEPGPCAIRICGIRGCWMDY